MYGTVPNQDAADNRVHQIQKNYSTVWNLELRRKHDDYQIFVCGVNQ